MAADRTPNDPSDDWTVPDLLAAIESAMSDGEYDTSYLLVPAARLLREQAEQLDTLRAAIGDPDNLRLLADTFDLPILARIAAAVEGGAEHEQ